MTLVIHWHVYNGKSAANWEVEAANKELKMCVLVREARHLKINQLESQKYDITGCWCHC